MLNLKPLLLVSGALSVEGGCSHKTYTPERRKGNSLAVIFFRRLRELRVLKTPYGSLVDPVREPEIEALLYETSKTVATFNSQATTCFLWNSAICEPLSGAKLAGVGGWISKKTHLQDFEVLEALPNVLESPDTFASQANLLAFGFTDE